MPFEIHDGNPFYLSPSVKPSSTVPASPTTEPPWADPDETPPPNSPRVDVYVRVDNTGAAAIPCPTGLWGNPVAFDGVVPANDPRYNQPPNFDVRVSRGDWEFRMSAGGDTLWKTTTNQSFTLPNATSGRKCWGWSPDGHWLAYAYEPVVASGRRWHLVVIALDDAVKYDNTVATPRTIVQEVPSTVAGSNVGYNDPDPNWMFDESTFGWVGSSAVFTHGKAASGSTMHWYLANFRAATSPSTPAIHDQPPYDAAWRYLASPCGSQIAFVHPGTAAAPEGIVWWSTETGLTVPKRSLFDYPTTITTIGAAPTVRTVSHGVLGVTIDRGDGASLFTVDDPDDTEHVSGLTVRVDRVSLSTLLSGSLGFKPVGTAIVDRIDGGSFRWVQVPNPGLWARQNETHWCLLAQVYDVQSGLPRVWDGAAVASSTFPAATNDRCAQRNVDILA